jgi:hypothetical protein
MFSNSKSTDRNQSRAILLAISCAILIIPTAKSGLQTREAKIAQEHQNYSLTGIAGVWA